MRYCSNTRRLVTENSREFPDLIWRKPAKITVVAAGSSQNVSAKTAQFNSFYFILFFSIQNIIMFQTAYYGTVTKVMTFVV